MFFFQMSAMMLPSDDDLDDDLEPLYEDDRQRHFRWQDPKQKFLIAAAILGLVSITALIVVVTVTQLHNMTTANGSESPPVETTCGRVIGSYQDGIYVFKLGK